MTQVHLYRELESVARVNKTRFGKIFENDWMWEGVLRKHLDTLRELSLSRKIYAYICAVQLLLIYMLFNFCLYTCCSTSAHIRAV